MCLAQAIAHGTWIFEYRQRMHDTAERFRDLCSDIPDEWCESIGKQGFDILLEEIASNLMR